MLDYRKIAKGAIALLLCTVLSACTSSATALPFTKTPQIPDLLTVEIRTPTNIPAILKPSSTFTYTVQPTHKPSSTPSPFYTTDTIQPIRLDTVDLRSTLYVQTLDVRATQLASFPTICDRSKVISTSLSPNGNWLAISIVYPCFCNF